MHKVSMTKFVANYSGKVQVKYSHEKHLSRLQLGNFIRPNFINDVTQAREDM